MRSLRGEASLGRLNMHRTGCTRLSLYIQYTCMSTTSPESTQPLIKQTRLQKNEADLKAKGNISKSTIFLSLFVFLGLSWILSQTGIVHHTIRQHFPNTVEKMSNKKTVGYFVSPPSAELSLRSKVLTDR